jgi:hypothetical protein
MKILLGAGALILVAASLIADYKWRQWMAARRRERESEGNSSRHNF